MLSNFSSNNKRTKTEVNLVYTVHLIGVMEVSDMNYSNPINGNNPDYLCPVFEPST